MVLCPELTGNRAACKQSISGFIAPHPFCSGFQPANDLFRAVIRPGNARIRVELKVSVPIPAQAQNQITQFFQGSAFFIWQGRSARDFLPEFIENLVSLSGQIREPFPALWEDMQRRFRIVKECLQMGEMVFTDAWKPSFSGFAFQPLPG